LKKTALIFIYIILDIYDEFDVEMLPDLRELHVFCMYILLASFTKPTDVDARIH
jgi:hypothetical protein